jgi:hypothetical protein
MTQLTIQFIEMLCQFAFSVCIEVEKDKRNESALPDKLKHLHHSPERAKIYQPWLKPMGEREHLGFS